MPPREQSRIERLDSRVGWLDRHRRPLALVSTALLMPAIMVELTDALGVDWPGIHIAALGFVLGVAVWWAVEVGLAWLTAMWETEHSRLLRDRGLPRATLRRTPKMTAAATARPPLHHRRG